MRDVIFKQAEASGELQAHEEMRQMLAAFVARLSQMTESTSTFHSKLDESARLIEQAKSLTDVAPVLKDVVGATRAMAQDTMSARDELRGMREKAPSPPRPKSPSCTRSLTASASRRATTPLTVRLTARDLMKR